MTTLTSLPAELLHRICSYSELATCKDLRLTCQTLRSVGTHWVFRDIWVSAEEDSCEKVEKILAEPELAQCVTRFKFNLIEWDGDSPLEDSDEEEEYEDMGEEISVLPRRFRNFFKRLPEFPKLQDVAVSFHHECIAGENDWADPPQALSFRSAVMERFLKSILALPRMPRGLAIRNLQNVNETEPEVVANLHKVLGAVRSLRLNIAHEHSEGNGETDIECDEPHIFFDEFPSFWLKPAVSNLHHLTIYHSMYFGFYPKLDLSSIHFPHLQSLSLGNYTFIHDSQLDWILSHAATLTALYLDDCPIIHEAAVYSPEKTSLPVSAFTTREDLFRPVDEKWTSYGKRWHDYLRAFRDGLPLLRVFRFGHSESWWEFDSTPFEAETSIEPHFAEECYMVYCDGFGPSQYMQRMIYSGLQDGKIKHWDGEILRPSEEDKAALRELCAKIGQRVRDEIEYYW